MIIKGTNCLDLNMKHSIFSLIKTRDPKQKKSTIGPSITRIGIIIKYIFGKIPSTSSVNVFVLHLKVSIKGNSVTPNGAAICPGDGCTHRFYIYIYTHTQNNTIACTGTRRRFFLNEIKPVSV